MQSQQYFLFTLKTIITSWVLFFSSAHLGAQSAGGTGCLTYTTEASFLVPPPNSAPQSAQFLNLFVFILRRSDGTGGMSKEVLFFSSLFIAQ